MKKLTILFLLLLGSAAAETPPNVLFIAIDDLNDWVGFMRNHPGVKTPNLDKLAKRGVAFTNAHCAAPACAPSRTALLTGLRPSTSGAYSNKDNWLENPRLKDVVTLPESFQKAGYITKGGGKIYHAHSLVPEAFTGFLDPEPWDEYFPSKERQMPEEVTPEKWPVNSTTYYKGRFDWAPLAIDDEEMADGKVVHWAQQLLSQEHEKPLFLAVGIYRPHIPWWTPKKYFDLHPLEEIRLPEVLESDLDDIPEAGMKFPRTHWQEWILENDYWEQAVQGYLASVSFTDAMVGQLLESLDNGPLADNTIVVLWSDHGYHLGHKQHWEKFALWEQATRVPLVFVDTRKGSNWAAGAQCVQPASLLDIYPTLIELCGLIQNENLEGESLSALLVDPNQKSDRAVVTTHGFQNHAVRSERWRYIRYTDGSEELYDHQEDPNEFNNLANLEQHAQTKTDLAKWLPKINNAN